MIKFRPKQQVENFAEEVANEVGDRLNYDRITGNRRNQNHDEIVMKERRKDPYSVI